MWKYVKKLEYPINIRNKDLRMAKYLFAQYGGPDGEMSASTTYLNQRYSMPDERGFALLTDIGTEELAHVEMIATMISQLVKGATPEEMEAAGLGANYVLHDHAVFPSDPNGVPFTTSYIAATGDCIADLEHDMAAEQKARAGYEHVMAMTNDPDLLGPLSFLRQREIVHFNRFKELKKYYEEKYNKKYGG